MIDFRKMTKKFLMREWKEAPTLSSYIQSVHSIVNSLKPRTIKERNNLSIVKYQVNEIRKLSRKLEEKVQILEEQIKVLEEGKSKDATQNTSK